MLREFSADNLVVLPRVNVDSGLALWQALRAVVAGEKKLPRFLQQPWLRVEYTGSVLFQAAQSRLGESGNKAPSAEKRTADTTVDNAVGAVDDFLAAWARLPSTLPESQAAVATRQRLFPEGLAFLKLPFEQEWAQIERRVALMKSEGLDQQIALLGGMAFVKNLLAAHSAYGKVLGLTAVPATPAETTALRDPLAELSSALRTYVIKVTAYRDEDEPETLELAERLLRPLMEWKSAAASSSGESEPGSDPTPTTGDDDSPSP